MSRFIALPVAKGDAFYLERNNWSVLVDGGQSRSALAIIFQTVTQRDGVNVAICTHNDADHANGILGFLEVGLRCEEAWLPGRWASALSDVLMPFDDVFVELADNVAHVRASSNKEQGSADLSPIEAYGEDLLRDQDETRMTEDGSPLAEEGWPTSVIPMLEKASPWESAPWVGLWPPDRRLYFAYRYYQMLAPREIELLWSAIEAAGRIRAIAIEAFHRGIPVRWFEFDDTTCSGGLAILKPLNAREIARVRPRVGPLLAWLALTVVNRQSLVFWSPPSDEHAGTLFTADSDLSGVRLPGELGGAIITAPHHGSEANAKAYVKVSTVAKEHSSTITWVRSDGKYRSRPGTAYTGLSSRRLCTLCRHSGGKSSPKQTVHLFSRRGIWARHRATVECSCQ